MISTISRGIIGSLYTWNANSTIKQSNRPLPLDNFQPGEILKCQMGNNHTALLTQQGKVFTFGKGQYGALGHDNQKDEAFPKLIESLIAINLKIKDIAVGQNHTLLLSTEGDVWSMGYGGTLKGGFWRRFISQDGGGLGHGDQLDKFVPTPIQSLRNTQSVQKVFAGTTHSAALGESGKFYIWGRGECGVLGNGLNKPFLSPILNPIFQTIRKQEGVNIKKIGVSQNYSAVLFEDGRIFSWGKNDDGQLGTGTGIGMDMYECQKWPTEIVLPNQEKVLDFQLGESISIFRSESNQIFVSGLKKWWSPNKLLTPEGEISSIFACGRFAGFVIERKDVYFVGNMLSRKERTEIYDLGIWKTGDDFFQGKKIEKIGGSGKNNYCFLVD